MKKFFACLLAVLMLVQVIPTAFAKKAGTKAQKNDEPKYYISLEGATIGQGMYVEPTYYTLSEVQKILASDNIEVTEENITAAMLTIAMLKDKNIEYSFTGDLSSFYMSKLKGIDKGYIDLPDVITDNCDYTNDDNDGNDDEWLGEFDYSFMSGWMYVVDDAMAGVGAGQYHMEANSYIRWQFTFYGYGADLGYDTGWGMPPYFEHASKDNLNKLYADISRAENGAAFFGKYPEAKTSAIDVMGHLTATDAEMLEAYNALNDLYKDFGNAEAPRVPRELSKETAAVLTALANTVQNPNVGSVGGEWAVLALARGGHFDTNNEYFEKYYQRVVEYVNAKCPAISYNNGALDESRATENARIIIALSAIGKDARKVGDWNLITPLSNFDFVSYQGINGPVYTLIALDSRGYETEDPTIRQQCIDYILGKECANGGFAYFGTTADPDMTSMTLQALAPYRNDNAEVAAVIDRALSALSSQQRNDGGFASWGSVNSESCAQVITACATLGINPDTDSRFVKENGSVLDALMSFYLEDTNTFAHTGTSSNQMATEQGAYTLVAYQRMMNNMNTLYDMSDVQTVEYDDDGFMKINAIITAPAIVSNSVGATFNAQVSLSGWDTEKEYKLLDAIVAVPNGLKVSDVKASEYLTGGNIYWQLEEETGKLRIVYSDANGYGNISVGSNIFPAEIFTITFELESAMTVKKADIAITGMSLKLGADSQNPKMLHIINTDDAACTVAFKNDRAVFAYILYTGDGVDLISENMQAVAVLVTETDENTTVNYKGTELLYSEQLSEKTGVATYIKLMNTENSLSELNNITNYTFKENNAPANLMFGDVNHDGVMNAQDALNTVNAWLRKGDTPSDNTILAMNINGDSRINTFDALGITDSFVNGTELIIVKYGASLSAK